MESQRDFDQHSLLRIGIILLGLVLLTWTVRAIRSGETTGYYRSHIYTRENDPMMFTFWVAIRGTLGLVALIFGFLLP